MIRSIENCLVVLLGLAGVVVFVGAILMMADMDGGSVNTGGRYYVAVFALFALGAIDLQIQKVLYRRIPWSFGTTSQESRYALVGLLTLIAAGAVLIGVAGTLPYPAPDWMR